MYANSGYGTNSGGGTKIPQLGYTVGTISPAEIAAAEKYEAIPFEKRAKGWNPESGLPPPVFKEVPANTTVWIVERFDACSRNYSLESNLLRLKASSRQLQGQSSISMFQR